MTHLPHNHTTPRYGELRKLLRDLGLLAFFAVVMLGGIVYFTPHIP